MRFIEHKLIDFLAQLENFQKRLWLKRKFVVETTYCITLDLISHELYDEIAANDAQREEWVRLFAFDEIKGNEKTPGYSVPLTIEFLKSNDKLLLDTRFFGDAFCSRLLASLDNLDMQIKGVLVRSDNFQALSLLATGMFYRVWCPRTPQRLRVLRPFR